MCEGTNPGKSKKVIIGLGREGMAEAVFLGG